MTRILAIVLAGAAVALTVAGSQARLDVYTDPSAMIRASWSARPERIETCRRLTDEEYAKLPAHMRQRVECEGTTARYRLEVLRDGVVLAVDTVRGGGLRHDRELYALREIPVPGGRARVTVRFVRLDSSTAGREAVRADTSASTNPASRAAREDAERERRRAEAIPPLLTFDTTVTLRPRTVFLITYSEGDRRLVAVPFE